MSALAGKLRERIVLATPSGARDALGAVDGQWTIVGTMWAAITPDGRSAIIEADALSALARWRVVLRPCALRLGDRISWDGRTLMVREVRRDPERRDRIEAIAEEIA